MEPTGQDVYNSDSFITVPLVNGDQVVGVLNLSNKSGGLPFDQIDLDRAMLTGSLLAMSLGRRRGGPARCRPGGRTHRARNSASACAVRGEGDVRRAGARR